MNMNALKVGVDVSQKTLDVATTTNADANILDMGSVNNDKEGFHKLEKCVMSEAQKIGTEVIQLIVEPTGGYEQPLIRFAIEKGWRVSFVAPHKVRQWAKGVGIRGKTDRMDARNLARYGASCPLPEYTPMPEEVSFLDDLLKRKEELESNLRREANRLHAFKAQGQEDGPVFESMERGISWLQDEIKRIDNHISIFINDHPDLKEQAKRLKTVPGIGDRNCLFVLVLMHRWNTLTGGNGTSKQLAAFVGLDPVPHESGSSVHRREVISREGDSNIRRRLYMSAFGGIRGNNPLQVFYNRLVSRGKKKKLAIVAGARKILTWAWAVFRDNTTFDVQKFASSAK